MRKEHVFIEDIIYCPSQIYYYFKDQEGKEWCAYIRQRRGPLSFEIYEVDEAGDFIMGEEINPSIPLSRVYDINNQPDLKQESKEILELEKEVLGFLRQSFPGVDFPEIPICEVKKY